MKVCIIGSARSGTTAIYALLQKILIDKYNEVDFVYEPFLWDINSFNDFYENVKGNFKYTDSISHEGIASHLALPLFIKNTENIDDSFLHKIFNPIQKDNAKLIKIIRGNGRYGIFRKYDPDCKFIYIIRNPLDSVNSLKDKFSYYGGEFHKDDYKRFREGVLKYFNEELPIKKESGFKSELLWWYYINLFALESF
ncbi:MAG: sulfotransferase, partial [Bacteroidetes bacterium]|nr:sulfotransferase [Bacteroidota bacterium]